MHMVKSKDALLAVGVIVAAMGILGFAPGLAIVTEPAWHAALKVVIGAAAVWIALGDKK